MNERRERGADPEEVGFYSRFVITRVLSEFGTPILFIAEDPAAAAQDDRNWLFNWRAGGVRAAPRAVPDVLAGPETWIAVPISVRRLEQVTSERISLREALLLAEGAIFVLTGSNPFDPTGVQRARASEIGNDLLPRGEVSVFGNRIQVPTAPRRAGALQLIVHMIPGVKASEHPNVSVSSPVQSYIQRYLSWAARDLLQPESRLASERNLLSIPTKDWAGMSTLAAGPGSLTVVLEAEGTTDAQKRAIEDALKVLKAITSGTPPTESGAARIGTNGLESLAALMDLLHMSDVSLSLRWGEDSGDGFAMIGVPTAERLFRNLSPNAEEPVEDPNALRASVRVRLTPDEVTALRREVNPKGGGHQSLIFALQKQLDDETGVLLVAPEQVEPIIRYVQDYGAGGFQDRLRPVYKALQRMGTATIGVR